MIVDNLFFRDMPYQFDGTNGHVSILIINSTNITVRNVDFENVSQPIAIMGGSNITVEYTRTNGITGPSDRHDVQTGNFLQTVGGPTNIKVLHNKIKGGDTEDIISGFSAIGMEVAYNEIDGTGWSSDSGTGIIVADGGGSDQWVHDNTLYNPGQVGIAIAGGTNSVVEDNIIYGPQVAGANIAAYCNNYYPGTAFGNNTFRNNRAFYQQEDGTLNGFWNPGGCVDVGNNWVDVTVDPHTIQVVF